MSKPMNHKRRLRAAETAQAPKQGHAVHVAAMLRSGSGRHKDQRKEASRKACRGKVSW
jgi:hypothetical protein